MILKRLFVSHVYADLSSKKTYIEKKLCVQSNLFPRHLVLILFSVKNITIGKMRINCKRNTQMRSKKIIKGLHKTQFQLNKHKRHRIEDSEEYIIKELFCFLIASGTGQRMQFKFPFFSSFECEEGRERMSCIARTSASTHGTRDNASANSTMWPQNTVLSAKYSWMELSGKIFWGSGRKIFCFLVGSWLVGWQSVQRMDPTLGPQLAKQKITQNSTHSQTRKRGNFVKIYFIKSMKNINFRGISPRIQMVTVM